MAALDHDKAHDVGEYLEESSSIQAACPWYPPTNLSTFKYKDAEECAASMESLLLGYNTMRNIKEAYNSSPVSKVTKDAPPFLIIHGIMIRQFRLSRVKSFMTSLLKMDVMQI